MVCTQSRGRSPRGLSAGPTVNPDDVKDVLGKYERLEKLAESFFVTKPTRRAAPRRVSVTIFFATDFRGKPEAHDSWIRSFRLSGTHGQKMGERIVD